MERAFAETLAFLILADVYAADPPHVSVGLTDNRALSLSDTVVVLFGVKDADGRRQYEDAVALDEVADSETAARKLAGWLSLRDGKASGVEQFEGEWSAWVEREDGKIVDVGRFGYGLFPSMEAFRADDGGQTLFRPSGPPG
jgi:hypothetical protein